MQCIFFELILATFIALVEISVAVTFAFKYSFAREMAIQPEPVQRSKIFNFFFLLGK